jgi:XTP/dITP diphosphohydrolase
MGPLKPPQPGRGELVIATRNLGKFQEIANFLSPVVPRISSLRDFPEIPEIVENGATFAENAIKKARTVSRRTGRWALADDSGLSVEALQGRPGIFSSRYGGEGASDAERCQKLLREMASIPEGDRGARFICVMALASPGGETQIAEGECRGWITFEPKGQQGFGYDPIFFVPEFGRTMAELPLEVKNRISHRARALEKIRRILSERLVP